MSILKLGTAVRAFSLIEPKSRHVEKIASRGGRDPRPPRIVISHEYLKKPIEVSWLPFASEVYEVSANPKDYVIAPVPIVTCDIPNRNMDAFPFKEASRWNYLQGRITYQTFVGKPTCKDHDNQDPRRARGVHFDASLRRWEHNPKFWKITVLAGFDRTKDSNMVRDIVRGSRTGYSMGGLVDQTECAVCGDLSSGDAKCQCMTRAGKGGIVHGSLVYDICKGINWIETSSLGEDPADVYAHSPVAW